ncbi:MAG: hypothetical protein JRH06_12140 [Deltaproteobacteria bacterium]|nr:hypothetical protein [Deltaproteobacteria bacterium]MBW2138293.1 hypothetical protein [Deltaproteobacteria bacterium]
MGFKYKEITDIILRSFPEVYDELGNGFLESVYENASYPKESRRDTSMPDEQRYPSRYRR